MIHTFVMVKMEDSINIHVYIEICIPVKLNTKHKRKKEYCKWGPNTRDIMEMLDFIE